ncbi:hypothetical protein HYX17_01465 [Candidatus Woesearchaeota archaeon]|nr:hypothetical protein [Candidatus Woesearchaeota archaeon]
MKLKEYWKRLKGWQKGGLVGLLIGLFYIPFGLGLGSDSSLWNFLFELYLISFCGVLSIPQGESCAMLSLISSLIVIPLISIFLGTLIGLLIQRSKK